MTRKITDLRGYIKSKIVVSKNKGCWEWNGCKNPLGYGQIGNVGGFQLAHRLSFNTFKRKITGNICVLHKCDNPACVNPAHLYLGTRRDNMRDIQRRHPERLGKTKRLICRRGHKREGNNLYKDGSCVTCKKLTNKIWEQNGH